MALFRRNRLREQIGTFRRRLVMRITNLFHNFASRDYTQADYRFWDKAWRGQAQGLEVAGLFLKPLYSRITSWVMREPPEWELPNENEEPWIDDMQADLNTWFSDAHSHITSNYETSLGLGDCYLVVNPDLSLTIVPPHVVEPIVSEDDYSEVIGWRITERHDHPTKTGEYQIIVDEYYADRRLRSVAFNAGKLSEPVKYANLIGRSPVIHVPNRASIDELFGRPEAHALLPMLHRYGAILEAGLEGNLKQGRPTPVLEDFGDAQSIQWFFEKYGRVEKHPMPNGTIQEKEVVDFDSDELLVTPGKFKYAQPGPFAQETEKLLGLLFYILVQHSEMPEFAWGTAIASSKASAEEQMAPFVRFLEKKRGLAQGWMVELARVVMGYLGVMASRDVSAIKPVIEWKPLTEEDNRIVLDSLKLARAEGAIDRETLLRKLPIRLKDVAKILAAADAEAQARKDAFDAAIDNALNSNNDDETDGEDVQDAAA